MVSIGDVVSLFDGAFSTAIVTKVHEDGSVDLERPMMKITGVCPSSCLSIERMGRVDPSNLSFYKYRDGHDNRWYDKR